jgi:peptide deformylase
MAIMPILKWPDPKLGEVCAPVADGENTDELIRSMFDTMYAAPGRGLAAPQVGVMKRLFITDTTWKDGTGTPMVFINPRVVEASDILATAGEGCLSIPGITVQVTRPDWIVMAWTDPDGPERTQRFDGFAAACVQHELDHLNGLLTFDRLEPDARTEAEARYKAINA